MDDKPRRDPQLRAEIADIQAGQFRVCDDQGRKEVLDRCKPRIVVINTTTKEAPSARERAVR